MQQPITFSPAGNDLFNVSYTKEPTVVNDKMSVEQLEKIHAKEEWNFEAAMTLSAKYSTQGEYGKACQVRFAAASVAVELLPEDEEFFELEWENEENQEFIEIIAASGSDFYMHGDFEMAATLFETALSLDSEDHFGVIPQLAVSYLAIDDEDGYEALEMDIDKNSLEGALIDNFAAYLRKKGSAKPMPTDFVELVRRGEVLDEDFLRLIEEERVPKEAQAKKLYFKHLPLFEAYNDFLK